MAGDSNMDLLNDQMKAMIAGMTAFEGHVGTIDTNIAAILAAQTGALIRHGIPATATPFSAVNAAAITTTTHIAIKAAVPAKRHWITQAFAVNITAAELQLLAIEVGGVNVALLSPDDGADANPGKVQRYMPPIECAAGEAIYGIGLIAVVGDCFIAVQGFTEA